MARAEAENPYLPPNVEKVLAGWIDEAIGLLALRPR